MNQMVKRELRSRREIRKMRAAGLIVWEAHQAAARALRPGVTTAQLNQVYQDTFAHYGAEPLFLNYGGVPNVRPPFPAETCISINEEVVHGIPGPRMIQEGDIVSLDTGCRLEGWCGDAAVTHRVGTISAEASKLLDVTNRVLDLAIELMSQKSMWSDISREMETFVKDAGFSVVEDMVGHAIGKELHESPQVPNYFSQEWRDEEDFDLRPGVVIAIEPMVNAGVNQLVTLDDGWTIITQDRKPSAHFEHTVAVTKDGPIRLTGPPNKDEREKLPDWLQDSSTWVSW